MDASVLMLDLPAWLSGISDVLYVASFCLALFVFALLSCVTGQAVNAEDDPVARKSKTHLA